jgi:endoplasmic reticulum junction formation protein lunapark
MDVVLGEDESLPSNRIALICKQCRLVNGQAPPGAKCLEEVGTWRCAECGAVNGEETEMKKIIAGFKEDANPRTEKSPPKETDLGKSIKREIEGRVDAGGSDESDITQYSDASDHDIKMTTIAEVPEESQPTIAEPLRRRVGRPKGSKNKQN